MVKLARLLFIAVVALVVPLQGMAAVAVGQCMALGHHQGAVGQDDHHHDAGDLGHDHGSQAHDDEGDAHCGPCTACCASATIAAANDHLGPTSPSIAPYVFWQFPPFGDQPDALDRPPLAL